MIVKVNIVKPRFAIALALGWTIALAAGPAEAACSLADKVALAKAGYAKADIEKECAASTSTPAPATPSPAVQAPPPEVLAQHLRADPADKADLKAMIKQVQTKLNTFGFGAGTPDGSPGRKTGDAQERLKEAFGVDLAGLPYTEQNRILDHLLASEPGKKYVASAQKLGSLSKKVGTKLGKNAQVSRAELSRAPSSPTRSKKSPLDVILGTWCVSGKEEIKVNSNSIYHFPIKMGRAATYSILDDGRIHTGYPGVIFTVVSENVLKGPPLGSFGYRQNGRKDITYHRCQ